MNDIVSDDVPYSSEQLWRQQIESLTNTLNSANCTELFVVRRDELSHCWKIGKYFDKPAATVPIYDTFCIGSRVAARFLSLNLWQHQTVDELKKLVLLTLSFAVKENPWGVGSGFEILSVTNTGFRLERFKNDDVTVWRQKFDARLNTIFAETDFNLASALVALN